ncbi:2-polyprenylphenol hydroxylase [Ornithinimicrobium sp. LYQ92]|uniref:2-polyprenylphenol hydroxylase n=1 Tax=Serinicoccus sp. LYQ92 TaxID=3378798 RepID=UPI003852B648
MSADEDARWLVVNGRRWRRQDPDLPEEAAARLLSHLGRGRSAVRALRKDGEDPAPARHRVSLAKHGLGERGTPWWEQDAEAKEHRWQEALAELDRLDEDSDDEHSDDKDSDGKDPGA